MFRSDLIFSYWVFVWFMLFVFKIIPYNPTFILVGSLGFTLLEVLYMLHSDASNYNTIKFIVINIILKSIPIMILWYLHKLKVSTNDIFFTITIFVIYNIYLFINGTNLLKIYKHILNVYIRNSTNSNHKTLLSNTYDYLYSILT